MLFRSQGIIIESSAVAATGTLYYNTLFDENASCHLALGFGFTNLLPGYENMTPEECRAAGINSSISHVDFMLGTGDMKITGITGDGREIAIFEEGEWTPYFAEDDEK